MIRRILFASCVLLSIYHSKILDRNDRDGESCGPDSVPYLIEIDTDGRPELYCDVPVCFDPPHLRRSGNSWQKKSRDEPICNGELGEKVCDGEREWTSGLREVDNRTHRILKTECCTYEGLIGALALKVVLLEPGEQFQGGPIRCHGRECAFDLIKEVRKAVDSQDRLRYEITVYRMLCTDERRRENVRYAPQNSKNNRGMQQSRRAKLHPGFDEYDINIVDFDLPIKTSEWKNGSRKSEGREVAAALALANLLWPTNEKLQQRRSNKTDRTYGTSILPEDSVDDDPVAHVKAQPPQKDVNGIKADSSFYSPAETYAPEPYSAVIPQQPESYTYPDANIHPPSAFISKPVQSLHLMPPPQQLSNYQPSQLYQPQQYSYQSQQLYQPQQYSYQPQQLYQPQQYQYSYYPSQAYGAQPGLNDIFGSASMQCFSGDLLVQTSEGEKRMRELKKGDLVLCVDENVIYYQPIMMFLHRDEDQLAEFNVITTESGDSVKLTNEHLIYASDCDPESQFQLLRARKVTTAHCVMAVHSGEGEGRIDRVVSVTKTHDTGIYAPLTPTGNLIVNGVLSSCHSNLALATLQQTFFSFYRMITRHVSILLPSMAEDGSLPLGLSYLSSTLDLFIPAKAVW